MKIGTAEAATGQKVKGVLEIPFIFGQPIPMPVGIVTGRRDGPVVGITAGVHGCEYPGIESTQRLFQNLDPDQIFGTVIVVPVVNMPGYQNITPFLNPIDGLNLNRVFPGDGGDTATYRIARTVFNEVALRCDYFLDCHGSDIGEDQFPNVIVPAAGDPDTDAKAEAMARAVGTEFIRRLDLTTPDATRGTFAGEVIRRGIPAMITEIGGHGRYTEEEIDLQNRAAVNVLRHVGVLKGDPEPLEAFSEQKIFNWPAQSYRVVTGVGGSYHRRVGPRSPVKRGDLLAEIKDEWGEVIESFYSQHDAVVRLVNPWRIVKPGDSLMNLFRLEG